jgi:hypothetical protein
MKKNIKIILPLIMALSFSSFASDQVETKNYTEDQIRAIVGQSISLINYETREKELILEPLKMTRDEALKFIPPLKESPVIYDIYIESGYNVIDSIKFTHMDIIELYKGFVEKPKER